MKTKLIFFSLLLLAILSFELVGAVPAQPASADIKFAHKIARGDMIETKLGQLAMTHAQSPSVKKFGVHMMTDHVAVNRQLQLIAQRAGITLPTQFDAKDEALINHFSQLQGKSFDHEYMNRMVESHRKDLLEFDKASDECVNPDFKLFAEQNLIMIQKHLNKAEKIQAALK